MKVAYFAESPADQAALTILTEAILNQKTEPVLEADLRQRGFNLRLALEDDPSNHAMYVAAGVPCVYIHSGYYE